MIKRLRLSAISMVALLLCAAFALGFAAVGSHVQAAEATAEQRAVVLDKIEDFRTELNDDGTYTILGLTMGGDEDETDDFVKSGEMFLDPDSWTYNSTKTGLSAVGLRKILGLAADDNLGLTDEDEIYSALYTRFLQGDIEQDGYMQFKIAIPETVSVIEDFAFVSGFAAMGASGGSRNVRILYGYNDKSYVCKLGGYERLASVDFVAELGKILAGEESDLTDEEMDYIVNLAMLGIGMGTVEFGEDGSLTETAPHNSPSLVEFGFAKAADGTRKLASMGKSVLGVSYMIR